MYKVSEIENKDLSSNEVDCIVNGKFFYRIAGSVNNEGSSDLLNCYIADSSNDKGSKLFLSDHYGESVIDMDETFGMMVGGEFAYHDIDVTLECIITRLDGKLACRKIKTLTLQKNGKKQKFIF